MSPFVNGTFYPFTSLLSPRSPILSPRYRSRSSRSPANNLIQLQSPILGLRFSVPAGLMSLFGMTPPSQPNQSQQLNIPLNGALLQLVRSLLASQNYGNYPNQNYRPPEPYLPPNIILKISPEFSIPPNVGNPLNGPHVHNEPHLHNVPVYHGSHIHNIPTYHNRPYIHDSYGSPYADPVQRFPTPHNIDSGQNFPVPPQRIPEFSEPPLRIPEQQQFNNQQPPHYPIDPRSFNQNIHPPNNPVNGFPPSSPNGPQFLPPGV